ncbi:MAG: GPR endopeptidase, partial [Bacillota bacterium]
PGAAIPGVQREQRTGRYATVQRVRITSPQGAAMLGKAEGTYTTIAAEGLRERSQQVREEVAQLVAEELSALLQQQGVPDHAAVLVAGLGNWNATPDSLGPRVVGQLLVTRHLHELLPPEKRGALRPVAAFSPGVLGLTGIETMELVAAAADRVRPAALVCVDALAAGSPERLCTTVQLVDSGIQPGAGVGNVRRALSRRELGIPVIAIGVPTVIHARRLVANGAAGPAARSFPSFFPQGRLGATEMGPAGAPRLDARPDWLASLIVTPKEIDVLIEDAAELLAGALNTALHPGLDLDEVLSYIQ